MKIRGVGQRAVALGLLAGLAASGACGPQGCNGDGSPPELGFLEYIHEPSGTVLVTRIVAPGQSGSLDQENLEALTGVPLNDIVVRYRGVPGRRSEVYTFAQDLATFRDDLRQATEVSADVRADALGQFVACEADQMVRLNWRPVSVQPRVAPLGSYQFFGPPNTAPCGESAETTGEGSVKSAIIYDRGVCSYMVQDLQTQLRDGVQKTWGKAGAGIFDTVHPSTIDVERVFTRAVSYVEPARDGGVPGGILFAQSLAVEMPFPLLTLFADVAYDFKFRLNNGLVEAPPETLLQRVEGGGLPLEIISNEIIQLAVHNNLEDQKKTITELIQGKQIREASEFALVGAAPTCEIDPFEFVHPSVQCQGYIDAINFMIEFGYDNMVDEGLLSVETTAAADKAKLMTAVADASNWICSADQTCKVVLRGKRLNVYPDAVEVVWFDEPDLNSFAFAIYVMIHGATGQQREDSLEKFCKATHDSLPTAGNGLAEAFAGYHLQPCDECENRYCTECDQWGCDGCPGRWCSACCASEGAGCEEDEDCCSESCTEDQCD